MKPLPAKSAVVIGSAEATSIAAFPLSCIDHPQAAPEHAGAYLWAFGSKPFIPEGYDKSRAFYGCYDWHSAVNSLWTMAVLTQAYPDLPLAPLMREKLKKHLGKSNLAGELSFFKQAKDFEKPYGYAWLIKLHAEMARWDNADAKVMTADLSPLRDFFSGRLVDYFNELPYATRSGIHQNTAFSMNLVLDATELVPDPPLHDAVVRAAKRMFQNDRHCPTAYEPGGADFLSPCLTEAKLMGRVLGQKAFLPWLDQFLPPTGSEEFKPLTTAVDVKGITSEDLLAGKSHLIGLAWQRAEAMLAIAALLPPTDPRVPIFHRLATINAEQGLASLTQAGYLGSHWLGTFVAMYMKTAAPTDAIPSARSSVPGASHP
ncbi:DUF2891 family protein [Acidipila rosea]|nr:DUF2891 family protein [Acidipila rosea]